ncbi:MAG: RNA methyltransferase [Bradymonadales bacterium]|nr:MAG: RNA methyltransferase [Bradymonadales bacterium]
MALIHYPVINRNQEIVTSSVTNLDLHDIARAARTFGLKGYFVVHPSKDQQALNRRIIHHWMGAYGQAANRTRSTALDLIRLVSTWEEVLEQIQSETGELPLCVGTHARREGEGVLGLSEFRQGLGSKPGLLVFGTAYGLAPLWWERLEAFLDPILGPTDYNHLSVRSAVSIYLDRIFGRSPD